MKSIWRKLALSVGEYDKIQWEPDNKVKVTHELNGGSHGKENKCKHP